MPRVTAWVIERVSPVTSKMKEKEPWHEVHEIARNYPTTGIVWMKRYQMCSLCSCRAPPLHAFMSRGEKEIPLSFVDTGIRRCMSVTILQTVVLNATRYSASETKYQKNDSYGAPREMEGGKLS